ncbi:MAG: hypothetical protein B1H04_00875 [Planctomycetales bacterium 4484_123]|nr:MAG: hypothetical protein B1H04_00875 [Planctomycetales bacterium 4484_123]
MWFAVGGDLRFLSHHEMMRLMERAVARAELPVEFSRGFNPRPRVSLPLPRPVGVASRCELMLLRLSAPMPASELKDRLARELPAGLTVLRAQPLPTRPVKVIAASYEMHLDAGQAARVRQQLAELARAEAWPVVRGQSGRGERRQGTIDLKGKVAQLSLEGQRLSFVLPADLQRPARCLDVLVLLGLAGRTLEEPGRAADAGEALASLVRTDVECRFDSSKDVERDMDG